MLTLNRFKFENIRRYISLQEIDFNKLSHLSQIDAVNNNTGGSSGAGKSTIGEAIAYLFGINEIPVTQLQSRLTKDGIWVQGEFLDHNGNNIVITRCKKDGLSIAYDNENISGSNKIAEEKLDEIIGIPRELFKRICYKRQKEGGFFLNLTPKQSYNFIMKCSDLDEIEGKIVRIEDKIKEIYKPTKERLTIEISGLNKSLESLSELLSQKTKPIKPEDNSDSLELKLRAIEQQLTVEQEQHNKNIKNAGLKPEKSIPVFNKNNEIQENQQLISNLKKEVEENINLKKINLSQIKINIDSVKAKIENCKKEKENISRYRAEIVKLNNEINELNKNICYTCKREWHDSDILEKKTKISNEINRLVELATQSKEIVDNQPSLESQLDVFSKSYENLEKEPINEAQNAKVLELEEKLRILKNEKENIVNLVEKEYYEKINNYNAKIKVIEDVYRQKTQEIIEKRNSTKIELDYIKFSVKSYNDQLAQFEKDYKNINDRIVICKNEIEEKTKELDNISTEHSVAEESLRLIKAYTIQVFQDNLNYIGDRATEILSNIPNMSNSVIYFEGVKENKQGRIKDEITPIINLEGDMEVHIKTLSGGERTAADFAVDTAIEEMIENRTNKGVNFRILDEAFDGLDSISKTRCIEVLSEININKKMIIIDHSSEIKEMVYDTIKVIREGEESYLEGA